jgi:hypothetical protein
MTFFGWFRPRRQGSSKPAVTDQAKAAKVAEIRKVAFGALMTPEEWSQQVRRMEMERAGKVESGLFG